MQEDAKRIVGYSKYPPLGSRGYGPMFASHSIHGVKGEEYDNGADKSLMVAVQIESRSGVDNVEEIAKVEGLDALLIGKSAACSHTSIVASVTTVLVVY